MDVAKWTASVIGPQHGPARVINPTPGKGLSEVWKHPIDADTDHPDIYHYPTDYPNNYQYPDYDNSSHSNDDMMDFLNDHRNRLSPGLPQAMNIFLILTYTVIILLSVSGNSLVILVVSKHAKMRTVTNAFLVSLAVSDLLVAVVTMPIQLVWYLDVEWKLGEIMCKFTRYFQGVVIVVSILTLTGIAVDRYYAICHPLRARHVHTLTRAAILIVLFWAGGFLAVLPQVFVQRLESRLVVDENEIVTGVVFVCAEYFSKEIYSILCTFYFYIFLYLAPVLVVFVTYGRIAYKLWKRQPIGETPDNPRDTDRRLQEKKRIVRMLVVIVALFALSWFPFFTYHVYTLFVEQTVHDHGAMIAQAFFQLSGYSNCCVNPIIYCFMNDSFKKHFYKTMCCCKCFWRRMRRNRRSSTTENGQTPMVSTNVTNHSTL